MTTYDAFGDSIKAFITEGILEPLAQVSVKNRDADAKELVEKYIAELNLPRKDKKPKKATSSPKAAQRWDHPRAVHRREPEFVPVRLRPDTR